MMRGSTRVSRHGTPPTSHAWERRVANGSSNCLPIRDSPLILGTISFTSHHVCGRACGGTTTRELQGSCRSGSRLSSTSMSWKRFTCLETLVRQGDHFLAVAHSEAHRSQALRFARIPIGHTIRVDGSETLKAITSRCVLRNYRYFSRKRGARSNSSWSSSGRRLACLTKSK